MIKQVLIVGLGSFFGGGLRYLISQLIRKYISKPFPLGTLLVNLTGCLLIGIFYAFFEKFNLTDHKIVMFLTVGFCGGFTTFSTFIGESMNMLKSNNILQMSFYLGISVAGGMLALFFGRYLVNALSVNS